MKFILGQKLGMTRVFDETGKSIAVNKIKLFPCVVSQVKTADKDGYASVQIKAGSLVKDSTVKICEFRVEDEYKVGDKINPEFVAGDKVTVVANSKGKGFAGTIKRHGFKRGPESHGGNNVREPGSIGGGYPQRVVKGRRMAGHMGATQINVKNLKVIDTDNEIILISGAIPGPNKGIIKVFTENK
jgi:large subunit ribosomal protein L3